MIFPETLPGRSLVTLGVGVMEGVNVSVGVPSSGVGVRLGVTVDVGVPDPGVSVAVGVGVWLAVVVPYQAA